MAQIAAVTPRWLLHVLPWVSVEAGVYRVNHRKVLVPDEQGVPLLRAEGQVALNARSLRQVSLLRDLDENLLQAMAQRFVTNRYKRGDAVMPEGQPSDGLLIVAERQTGGDQDEPVGRTRSVWRCCARATTSTCCSPAGRARSASGR